MGYCTHPRSQGYTDDLNRSRCGACGDVWDERTGMFRTLSAEPLPDPPARVVVVDVRNGQVRADGVNIDLPSEGQESALRSLETADVVVEIHEDTMLVTQGYDKRIVLLLTTKSERQMSAEKADREKADRVAAGGEETTGMVGDRATFPDDPVDQKFKRVWDGSVPSGEPVEGGLKGY